MIPLLACALLVSAPLQERPRPILWLAPDGSIHAVSSRLLPGTAVLATSRGAAFDFDGERSGIELPDLPQFRLAGSMTLCAWVNLRSYVTPHSTSPGSQILFRGDDRSGLDPFHLTVGADGTVGFAIENADRRFASVQSPIELRRWTRVVASLDARTGEMKLWLDGRLVSQCVTDVRPMAELDPAWGPGLGIGNVQRASSGAHNQPLNGQIADLRLYDVALTPREIDRPLGGG